MATGAQIAGNGAESRNLGARESIEYFCRILDSYGIDLSAETLRQAKFDGAAARGPLLVALHDLSLLRALGWPRRAGAGVAQLRARLGGGGAALGAEGRVLLLHLLASWGCPPRLLAHLATPHPSSRAALLALAWLSADCRLFERALAAARPPDDPSPLLPPQEQDGFASPAARAASAAAAEAASARAGRAAALRGGLTGWGRAEAAAQHALAAAGVLRVRSKLLGALADGREQLLAALIEVLARQQQQQQQQLLQHQSPQQQQQPPPRRQRAPLSPLEAQLALSPKLLQQHESALASACAALQAQSECARHAHVFFAWAGSALGEERGARSNAAAAAGGAAAWLVGPTQAAAGGGGAAQGSGRARGGGGGGGEACAEAAAAVTLAEVAPLAAQLHGPCSATAERVLLRVRGQLRAAAAAAGASIPGGAPADPRGAGGGSADPAAAWRLPDRLQPFAEAAAAALGEAGARVLPEPSLGAPAQERPPAAPQDGGPASAAEEAAAAAAAWRRMPASSAAVAGGPRCGGGSGSGGAGAVAVVEVEAEVARLRGLALSAARRLARARAANKQLLSAAAARLFGAGGAGGGACAGCILLGGG
ncbi:hypothetical protein Rsub_05284 [Raphidocelis subcapitata]|uniref:Tubulin epsilon and delta complex protein 1 domain-containing protein n=1 Tax=Raphidocelis subcapitata TaxID=307507 RepID=A0A2V0NZU2_9CHLO|nr:hypothetical protein Rsub_05284 [Raphidocelis subcapitata]|eukprot:GBF92202.1 hypothetical protein Rsub_05284 [Raphidocelis subcapitata]